MRVRGTINFPDVPRGHLLTDEATWIQPPAASLFDSYSTVSNTTTSYEALYTHRLKRNQLINNGDKILLEYAGRFTTSDTKELIFVYGVDVFSTTEITTSGPWKLEITIVRTDYNTVTVSSMYHDAAGQRLTLGDVTTDHQYSTSLTLNCVAGSVGAVELRYSYGLYIPAALSDITPPSVPIIQSFAATSATDISLTWSASVDEYDQPPYYHVRIRKAGDTLPLYQDVTTDLWYDFTGLDPDTQYFAQVRASDENGNMSEWSGEVNTFTFKPDTRPPSVPQPIMFTADSFDEATLTWLPSTD